MTGYLILLFTLVPFLELYILIKLGQVIGAGYTLLIVIFTGLAGAYLAKHQGLITLKKIQEDINNGKVPAGQLIDGFIILCGGILLLTPGIITDILGLMGLIPFTRDVFKKWVMRKIQEKISNGQVITVTAYKSS
ncbi:MAG: FxsA family protein [Candidatus Omnitrophota bacterium]